MINFDVIPNPNVIDTQSQNANGALLAQLIMFYIGVAAFILVCCIPPFTLFLPFLIPILMVIVIFVNLGYFGKFLDRGAKKFQSMVDQTLNEADRLKEESMSDLNMQKKKLKKKSKKNKKLMF
jgi:hypothetical protein